MTQIAELRRRAEGILSTATEALVDTERFLSRNELARIRGHAQRLHDAHTKDDANAIEAAINALLADVNRFRGCS